MEQFVEKVAIPKRLLWLPHRPPRSGPPQHTTASHRHRLRVGGEIPSFSGTWGEIPSFSGAGRDPEQICSGSWCSGSRPSVTDQIPSKFEK